MAFFRPTSPLPPSVCALRSCPARVVAHAEEKTVSTAAVEPANSKMNDDLFTTGPTVNYNPLQKKVTLERLVDTRIPAGQTGALDRAPAGAVQTNDAGQVGGSCVWGPASSHVHCRTECLL